MSREECVKLFKEKSNYFSFKASNFDILGELDADELDYEENIEYTTPLLNEIFLYSLIYRYLDLDYLEGISGDDRSDFYQDAKKISSACLSYLSSLVDDGSLHPSVRRYASMSDGTDDYEIIRDLMSEIIDEAKISDNNIFFQLCEDVYAKESKQNGEQLKRFVNNVYQYKNPVAFMHFIAEHALDMAMRKLLFFPNNGKDIAVVCDNNISFVFREVQIDNNEDNKYGFIFNGINDNSYLSFLEIFNILEQAPLHSNSELGKCVEHAIDRYIEYKDNQYVYLKSSRTENLILNKRFPM